jgi:O-acetyl-ADP-ribose deacetylase (regulator of RNase III)
MRTTSLRPNNIKFLRGDLLACKEQCIAHQCNCVTKGSMGLAKSLFDRFPHANTYSKRDKPGSKPGSIDVLGNGEDERYVINMYAQYLPGGAEVDSKLDRLKLFARCLDEISELNGLESIAFPYEIGCGLARGDWTSYKLLLYRFAKKNPRLIVRIYRLTNH